MINLWHSVPLPLICGTILAPALLPFTAVLLDHQASSNALYLWCVLLQIPLDELLDDLEGLGLEDPEQQQQQQQPQFAPDQGADMDVDMH
jgi:hypothetical protein